MELCDVFYVGIDIAKAQLDIAVRPSGQQWVSPHDEAGIAEVSALAGTAAPVDRAGGDGRALMAHV
jgi:hypothetical protein